MKHFFSIILFLYCINSFGQVHKVLNLDSLYAFPGKTKPAASDISGKVNVSVTPDSLFFTVEVTDDKIINGTADDKGDHVEVWLGFSGSDFSDYIVSESKKRTSIFRNSSETGDNADLERFIKNGDYPSAKLTNPSTGKVSDPEVPEGKDLKRDYVFFGLTRFSFHPDNRPAKHLDRAKYRLLEKELGFTIDDLSGSAAYKSEKTATGYTLRIAMHNRSMGFGLAALTKSIRFAVDVFDADSAEENPAQLSSTPNRFYARANYFNNAELPFYMNITTNVPDSTIRKISMTVNVAMSGGQWKPFGYGAGSIIYGSETVSEAGLVEYTFYPITMKYLHSEKGEDVPFERVDQIYDDLSPFPQHDVYFLVDNLQTSLSSKEYMYLKDTPNNFVNTVFRLPDGSAAAVLYDYEAADPLGWGKYGQLADEFVYIHNIDGENGKSLYSGGHRIEVVGTAAFGETDPFQVQDVKSVSYRWLRKGKSFEVTIKHNKSSEQILVFEIGPDMKFVRKK